MRNPLVRILLALLIGVWSPMCCCQATAMVGLSCPMDHASAPEPASSCRSCCDDSKAHQGTSPTGEDRQHPGDCKSCGSCEATVSGAGLKVDVKLPAIDDNWVALSTFAVAVLFDLTSADEAVIAHRPAWWRDPPCVKANRDALRWHCALTV